MDLGDVLRLGQPAEAEPPPNRKGRDLMPIPNACRFHGHGPTIARFRRVPWAPWRTRPRVECWLCHTPLTAVEVRAADDKWADDDAYGPVARRTC